MTDKERIEEEINPAFRVDVVFENEDGTMKETKPSQFVITEGDTATLFIKVPNHFFNPNQKAVEILKFLKMKVSTLFNAKSPYQTIDEAIEDFYLLLDKTIKELGGKE